MTIEVPVGNHVAKVDDGDAWVLARPWFPKTATTGDVYAQRNDGGRTVFLHRAILGSPAGVVDHRNGDTLDNRRRNLRVVTQQVNTRNRPRKAPPSESSPFMGVSLKKASGRWQAYIGLGGNRIQHLGYFSTAEEANHARLSAEARLWGVEPRRVQAFKDAALHHLIPPETLHED